MVVLGSTFRANRTYSGSIIPRIANRRRRAFDDGHLDSNCRNAARKTGRLSDQRQNSAKCFSRQYSELGTWRRQSDTGSGPRDARRLHAQPIAVERRRRRRRGRTAILFQQRLLGLSGDGIRISEWHRFVYRLPRTTAKRRPNTQFYARADNLREWLSQVEKRLGSLTRRLGNSVVSNRINDDLAGDAPPSPPGRSRIRLTFERPGFRWTTFSSKHAAPPGRWCICSVQPNSTSPMFCRTKTLRLAFDRLFGNWKPVWSRCARP